MRLTPTSFGWRTAYWVLGLAGLASAALPLALAWAALGLWLGRQQRRLAAERERAADPARRGAAAPPFVPRSPS